MVSRPSGVYNITEQVQTVWPAAWEIKDLFPDQKERKDRSFQLHNTIFYTILFWHE